MATLYCQQCGRVFPPWPKTVEPGSDPVRCRACDSLWWTFEPIVQPIVDPLRGRVEEVV